MAASVASSSSDYGIVISLSAIFSCPDCCFFSVSSPDYLNNLSPDSKEYEDTQGKPAERSSVISITIVMSFQPSKTY